ncbi:MAG TPA: hypothetical protein VH598_04795, partial [Verrucomicrobiae bacterium]|nr:hypothetical protein [Verrucomicrobiae bacterium]
MRGWDVWNRDEGQLVDGSLFLNSPGVHYTTYDIGRAVIDGSISASNPSDWTLVSGNVWESTRSFPPRPGFTNGLPFNNANDIGNILWNFQAVGGNSPPEAMKATSGKMTGGGVGGVWYKPGDGINNLGTVDGNWNFNTDRYTAQIVSSGGNPATVFPGLRLSINAACIEFNG